MTAPARITWWVYAGAERIRKTANMRGTWGHDATCTCGWDSLTGGATRGSVERQVWEHKFLDHGYVLKDRLNLVPPTTNQENR